MGLQSFLNGHSTQTVFQPRALGLSANFTIAAGTPVHPLRPVQNIPLLRRALISSGHDTSLMTDDYEVLQAATLLFKQKFEREITDTMRRMGIRDIQFRNKPKNVERMRAKVENDYNGLGGAAINTDTCGCFVFTGSIEKARRVTEFFRPANHSKIVEMKEKAAVPDESGFCANTFKYMVSMDIGAYKAVPFIGEIIVMKDGCKSDYEASHAAMNTLRSINDFYYSTRKGLTDNTLVWALGKLAGRSQRQVVDINAHMAKATGLEELRETRSYHMVNDVPVMKAYDRRGEGFAHCVIPDTENGFYKIDNAYLLLTNQDNKITEKEFLDQCWKVTPGPACALQGENLKPALQVA